MFSDLPIQTIDSFFYAAQAHSSHPETHLLLCRFVSISKNTLVPNNSYLIPAPQFQTALPMPEQKPAGHHHPAQPDAQSIYHFREICRSEIFSSRSNSTVLQSMQLLMQL
ncbi:hypothetical protein GJ744_005523 [Endocarpon pusillum]|uniref:Uncharacterized protein n=1 Tax=Endocarpon pusillum TaxID=364733 RepID=A0A8H7AMZ7_9EURO|nr:hypothetical protein GJ744_005523 [Endocarpon pusillum]